MTQKDVALYYNVNVYIKFSHINVIFKSFHIFQKVIFIMKNIGHCLNFFLGTPYSLYSFKFLSIFFTIHQKHFHISSSNISLNNHLPQWKLSNGYILQWLLTSYLHLLLFMINR
jgi:hypothetical protein